MKYRYLQEAYRLSDSIENMAVSHQIDRQEQIRITSDLKEQSHIRLIVSITVSIIVVLLLSITVFFFYRKHLKRCNERIFAHKWERQEARAQENENRELQIIDIIRKAGETCSKHFKESNIYTDLYKKINSDKESLSYNEQKSFQTVILKEFDTYLQQVSSIVPLTDNDAFSMCIVATRFFDERVCSLSGYQQRNHTFPTDTHPKKNSSKLSLSGIGYSHFRRRKSFKTLNCNVSINNSLIIKVYLFLNSNAFYAAMYIYFFHFCNINLQSERNIQHKT